MGRGYEATKPVRASKAVLPLQDIQRVPILRSRVGPIDHDHVGGIAESIREGETVPRPLVFFIEPNNFLVGGWHTYEAYAVLGAYDLPVLVKSGTWAEAVVAAASQNQEYDRTGLKRTNADKRHVSEMVLVAHPEWGDKKIAAAVGVSYTCVSRARERLAETQQVPSNDTSPPLFREGQDGKRYPLPLKLRSRPSSRPEHLDPLQPSWHTFGGAVLPLLKNGIPLPRVLAASQLNLKQLSAVFGRFLDLYEGMVFDPLLGRALTDAEKAERLDWHFTSLFPELYVEGATFGDQLEILRDTRFPAGALP
jgi:hypothetical protein